MGSIALLRPGRLLASHRLRTAITTGIDQVYDRRYRIETRPATHTPSLDGERVGYYPLSYAAIRRIIAAAELGPEDVVYDLGCGKGRLLALLARQRIQRCIGVEVDAALAAIARSNIDTVRGRRAVALVAEGDAAAQAYADGTVFILYNPFGAATLQRVVENIAASLDAVPRRITLFYAHPAHEDVLSGTPWLSLRRSFFVPFQTLGKLRVSVWSGRRPTIPKR